MGLSKVTALYYILPVSFFNTYNETTKSLWDDIVEKDDMWQ